MRIDIGQAHQWHGHARPKPTRRPIRVAPRENSKRKTHRQIPIDQHYIPYTKETAASNRKIFYSRWPLGWNDKCTLMPEKSALLFIRNHSASRLARGDPYGPAR